MDLFAVLAMQFVFVALGFYVLFLVIRAAVAQALREHRRETLRTQQEGVERL